MKTKLFNNKTILITGGTGSFGKRFTEMILKKYHPKKIIIFSRDEYKQSIMHDEFIKYDNIIRYFIGDVRDKDRLSRAFNNVDIVVHAAALKQVPALEYNPIEAIKTNIIGAINVIDAAIDKKVKKVIALSTDKAVNPVNLYGGTKLVSDKLFVSANAYVGKDKNTAFSVLRFGNVAGSRGSIIPLFKNLMSLNNKAFPITDFQMTRFWLTLDRAVELTFQVADESQGGEIYVAKCPSFKIVDLAKAMNPKIKLKEIGVRPGEKLHEVMVTEDDSERTYEYKDYFIIFPSLDWWKPKKNYKKNGKKVEKRFRYASDTNAKWLSIEDIKKMI